MLVTYELTAMIVSVPASRSVREATAKRRAGVAGSPEYEGARGEEERLNSLVMELVRLRNRTELGTG